MIDYEEKKERERRRNREATLKTQEIAPIPKIVDKARRERTSASFKAFCEEYFSDMFYLKWSSIHLDVIQKIEDVVVKGEIFALAMPRGSGKTTLCKLAVLWAALTGKRSFCVLVASNANAANKLLEDLKLIIETNQGLFEDYPEVVYPVRKLERIAQRQRGQVYNGVPTRIDMKASSFVFPTIKGSVSSGARICVAGMTGSAIRGLSATVIIDGKPLVKRPDLVLADDPQDRESAQSEEQCKTRESIIKADILGMAGPGKKIALLITTTVIAENDLAQRLLDRSRNPEFRGKRYQLLESTPINIELWEEYRQIRDAELMNDGDGSKANEFYIEHRKELDEGASVSWEDRYSNGEISAIQSAMNLWFRDADAFQSEYQNKPALQIDDGLSFDASNVEAVCSGYERGYIPERYSFLTAFIDVHKTLLYWSLCAFDETFNGVVVDYGTYPKQKRRYFHASDAMPNLTSLDKGAPLESVINEGLQSLTDDLFNETYMRSDGEQIYVKRVLIDGNWGQMKDAVYNFCRESKYREKLNPSHGKFYGASSIPLEDHKPKPLEKLGLHWLRRTNDERNNRAKLFHVVHDSNYWKSFVFARLTAKRGELGRLVVNGDAREHVLFAEHLAAEYCVPTEARGRRVDEWKQYKAMKDNHWLDCLSGCMVAASMEGAVLPCTQDTKARRRSRLAEYYKGMYK